MNQNFISLNVDNRYFTYHLKSGIFAETNILINKIIELKSQEFSKEKVLQMLSSNYELEDILKSYDAIYELENQKGNDFKPVMLDKAQNLWLNIVHDCNMRCSYCFADSGLYNGSRKSMDKETVKSCIDYWYENKADLMKYNIYFFGGEPFMNTEPILYGMNYLNKLFEGTNQKLNYSITTNGTIFNEEFIKKISINSTELIISLDGLPEIHNLQRPFNASDKPTYDVIVKNISKFKKYFPKLHANIVITKKSAQFLQQSVEHLWSLGFDSVSFFLAIVDDEELMITIEDLEIIYPQIKELNRKTIENIINRKSKKCSNILPLCRRIHKNNFSIGCSFQTGNSIVFSPEGNIFNCYELMGQKKYSLGNIKDVDSWGNICKIFPKKLEERKCNDCWVLPICGGGCSYDNYTHNGDINEPSEITCTLTKFLINEALEMYSLLYLNIPNDLDYIFGCE